ncbi:AAA family ATPase [Pontibacter qinzhouensis]|uniref:DNA 3'-5' helicase II n=1 Tax=Pontibacter qinzhouensis TaxID=2603253 RepID=A0A5C8KAH6_9BACT|nr:UvrD-helicase domain-containing protein [Pontibacter qinzhouensis]TXK46379.1 AAA family ATPase [Pontibacter qinzhouensis]
MNEGAWFDSNIVSYNYLERVQPQYDFIVIDEVQDITIVQLEVIRRALHKPTDFILCGDSNQIVHPNFFSWSQIKTVFYQEELSGNIVRILATNYRNTPEVTNIANKLLLVKNARFGSIDKESTYLVKPNSKHHGAVEFFENKPKVRETLNQRTRHSARIAVLVMRNEDKAEAAKHFDTPLLFSVKEAKGWSTKALYCST